MKSTKSLKRRSNPQKNHICRCLCARVILQQGRLSNNYRKPISTLSNETENKVSNPISNRKLTGVSLETKKCGRKTHNIIRIPKHGYKAPFLITLYTSLSKNGLISQDNAEIIKAVNITLKAKNDLEEGKQWNGHIEIAENLKLKLYKTGLVLYHKNKRADDTNHSEF